MFLLFIGGIYYIFHQHRQEVKQREQVVVSKKEQIIQMVEPALPIIPEKIYTMRFSMQTLQTLRTLTEDSSDKVRFAAAELLWQLQDANSPAIIKNMLQNETDPQVKKLIIDMLAKDKSKLSLALLSEALKDYDKDTRLHAVEVIGSFSNREAIPALTRALQDYDEEVRLKALQAVSRIRRDIEANKEQQLRELEGKPLFQVE